MHFRRNCCCVLSSWCLVTVGIMWLFPVMLWFGRQCVSVVFPDAYPLYVIQYIIDYPAGHWGCRCLFSVADCEYTADSPIYCWKSNWILGCGWLLVVTLNIQLAVTKQLVLFTVQDEHWVAAGFEWYADYTAGCEICSCRSQTCKCKKDGDWLKRWVEAQHNILSCKVFHDWSMIKLGNILYLLDGSIFAVLFGTTSHCFCWFSLVAWLRKKDLAFWYFFSRIFLSCRVPTFRGQKVAKHGGHQGISFLFFDWTRSNL